MKLNKTLALAALVAGSLLAGSSALQAQDNTNTPPAGGPPGGGMRGRPTFEMISKQLDLTDDQKPLVKPIVEDMQKQASELRKDTSLTQEDRRAKMKEIRDGAAAKLKDILTPEQFAKWQKMGQRQRPPMAPPAVPPTTPPQQ